MGQRIIWRRGITTHARGVLYESDAVGVRRKCGAGYNGLALCALARRVSTTAALAEIGQGPGAGRDGGPAGAVLSMRS